MKKFEVYKYNESSKKSILLGQIAAKQNQIKYNFDDKTIFDNSTNQSKYILKILNNDSSITYSDVITIYTFHEPRKNENYFSYWPNPAKSELLYSINKPHLAKPLFAEIINLNGQVLNKITIKEITGKIDLSNLNNGVYFLKIYESSGPKINRIVISK